jgi:hypothetical protein
VKHDSMRDHRINAGQQRDCGFPVSGARHSCDATDLEWDTDPGAIANRARVGCVT